jgi:hypothetical protein
MSAITLYGSDIQFSQHLGGFGVDALTLNTTKLFIPVNVPVGFGPIRILKATWSASAILAQAGGTSTVTIQAGLPAALRTLVNAQSVLGGVANTPADFTQAAETALKEYTVPEGGIILCTLAVSNNAIGTNGALGVNIHWHSVPKDNKGDDVKHASFYLP